MDTPRIRKLLDQILVTRIDQLYNSTNCVIAPNFLTVLSVCLLRLLPHVGRIPVFTARVLLLEILLIVLAGR